MLKAPAVYNEKRKSGIPQIKSLSWGTTFCQFYQSEDDMLQILIPYLMAGLKNNEKCLWITSGSVTLESANTVLKERITGFNEYVKQGRLMIISRRDKLVQKNIKQKQSFLLRILDQAILEGFEGLRFAINETSFSKSDKAHIYNYNIIENVLYPRDKFDAVNLMRTVKNCRFALVRNAGRYDLIESSEAVAIKDNLRRTEEKLREIFKNMSEGFAFHRIVLDTDGSPCDYIFYEINEAFEKLTGLKAAEIIGRKVTEVLPGIEKDPGDWIGKYGSVALTGKPLQFENYLETLNKWYSISAYSPQKGFFVAIFSDITDRKLAEKALNESEQRWATTLASVGDAVIATDMNANITFLNKVAETLTGWSMADAAGKPVTDVFNIINEYSRKTVENPVNKTLRNGRITNLANNTVLIRKNGDEVPIDDSAAPIKDKAGSITGVVLIFRDISDRRRAEKAVREINETLEQKITERTALAEARAKQLQALAVDLIEAEEQEKRRLSELLHDDLQQLLAAAKMHLNVMRRKMSPDPVMEKVNELLEVSIVKSRRLSHELSPAILHHSGLFPALEWLAGQMNEQFGLSIRLVKDTGLEFKDSTLNIFMFRAVHELLFNVFKHSGVKEASVILSAPDGFIKIEVNDQGKGFDPGIMDSLIPNMGFGLMGIRERAKYIGGDLVIKSIPGEGSSFTLLVPFVLHNTGKRQSASVDLQKQTGRQTEFIDTGNISLLFVDDHKVFRQGLSSLLSGQPGIRVVGEASNGREALEKVRQLKPDVVLMDISMPVMNGIEATEYIKKEFPFIIIIGLSMHDSYQLVQDMMKAGASNFVNKTDSSTELLKAIYETIRHKQNGPQSLNLPD
ncbi:MAG: PAS domain S-box protein [Spirochaetota bacterium]